MTSVDLPTFGRPTTASDRQRPGRGAGRRDRVAGVERETSSAAEVVVLQAGPQRAGDVRAVGNVRLNVHVNVVGDAVGCSVSGSTPVDRVTSRTSPGAHRLSGELDHQVFSRQQPLELRALGHHREHRVDSLLEGEAGGVEPHARRRRPRGTTPPSRPARRGAPPGRGWRRAPARRRSRAPRGRAGPAGRPRSRSAGSGRRRPGDDRGDVAALGDDAAVLPARATAIRCCWRRRSSARTARLVATALTAAETRVSRIWRATSMPSTRTIGASGRCRPRGRAAGRPRPRRPCRRGRRRAPGRPSRRPGTSRRCRGSSRPSRARDEPRTPSTCPSRTDRRPPPRAGGARPADAGAGHGEPPGAVGTWQRGRARPGRVQVRQRAPFGRSPPGQAGLRRRRASRTPPAPPRGARARPAAPRSRAARRHGPGACSRASSSTFVPAAAMSANSRPSCAGPVRDDHGHHRVPRRCRRRACRGCARGRGCRPR